MTTARSSPMPTPAPCSAAMPTRSSSAGLYDASIGLIIDKRVLANAPDCWVTEGEKAYIARIALYQGGDASAVFAAERKAAEPTSEDQGGGVTLENPGLSRRPMCPASGTRRSAPSISPAIMAGVLVRQGDRVAYVTVGSAERESSRRSTVSADSVSSPRRSRASSFADPRRC